MTPEVGLVEILTTTKFRYPVSKQLPFNQEIGLMEFNFNTKMVKAHNIMGDMVDNIKLGEYITRVDLRTGDFVDSIGFVTNMGTRSPIFGSRGGSPSKIDIPEGYKIVGLFGGEGEFLDRIGFNITPIDESQS
jgi:hypothetical protein